MAVKESTIQKGILDYLEWYGRTHNIYFSRTGVCSAKLANGRYFKSGKPGWPDITVCHNGFIGIELKTATGRQSKVQQQAEKDMVKAGGEYYIVRSLADIKAIFPMGDK